LGPRLPVLDDVNFFHKIKNFEQEFAIIIAQLNLCRLLMLHKSIGFIQKVCHFTTLQLAGLANKSPHTIDKFSNLADSRRNLWNAFITDQL
jgi:hypothetical protein